MFLLDNQLIPYFLLSQPSILIINFNIDPLSHLKFSFQMLDITLQLEQNKVVLFYLSHKIFVIILELLLQ
jgi:hypothetical protein